MIWSSSCSRNPGFRTIEEELMKAFRDSGAIADEWYTNMQQAFFQRASRTDKGVSAAKMIISLKLCKETLFSTVWFYGATPMVKNWLISQQFAKRRWAKYGLGRWERGSGYCQVRSKPIFEMSRVLYLPPFRRFDVRRVGVASLKSLGAFLKTGPSILIRCCSCLG